MIFSVHESSSRKSHQLRSAFLLLNLAVAMFFLNVLLILDEQYFLVESESGCLIVSILLHFSVLTVVSWMTIEAVNFYLAVVHKFYKKSKTSNATAITLSFSWGWLMPLLFVAIVAAVDRNVYLREDAMCWLNSNWVVYLLVIPTGVLLGICFLLYLRIAEFFISKTQVSRKLLKTKLHHQFIVSTIVFVLMVGSWLFGFVLPWVTDGLEDEFSYAFAAFIALQGLFTFILYGVRQGIFSGLFSNSTTAFETGIDRTGVLETVSNQLPDPSVNSRENQEYDSGREDEENSLDNRPINGFDLNEETESYATFSDFNDKEPDGQLHSTLLNNITKNNSFKYELKRPAVFTGPSISNDNFSAFSYDTSF